METLRRETVCTVEAKARLMQRKQQDWKAQGVEVRRHESKKAEGEGKARWQGRTVGLAGGRYRGERQDWRNNIYLEA